MRKIITVPYTEFLLRRAALHPERWVTAVKVMSKQDFQNTFQMEWPLCGVKEKVLTVVPLELDDNKVLPLPFVVDTGAPGIVFLGFKLRQLLYELRLLKEIPLSVAPCKLYGSLLWKGNRIKDPFVHDMPVEFELNPDKDIRTNVIGLDGIMKLGFWRCL